MSKVSPLVNGDNTSCGGEFEEATFNMVAISDPRSHKSQDFTTNQDKCTKLYSCDFDHMYASVGDGVCSSNQDKDKEIKYLKDLLLLHLDLVQQQSEQLVTKDKQIESLQKELSNTLNRCQRLERRVTLRKQQDQDQQGGTASCNRTSSVKENSVNDNELGNKTCLTIPLVNRNMCESRRGRGRRSCINGDIGVKRRASTSSSNINYDVSMVRKRRTTSVSSDKNKSISSDAGTCDEGIAKFQNSYCDDLNQKCKQKLKMKTEQEYYTLVCDEKLKLTIKEVNTDGSDLKSKSEQVPVPRWRERQITPLYMMEGTENLGDEVFSKRHQRLELDERRRKRWDIQRIREQHQIDKLKQRESKHSQSNHDSDQPLSSYYPCVDDLQEIIIQDELPVCIFGMQLAVVERINFTRTWSMSRQQRTTDKRRKPVNS